MPFGETRGTPPVTWANDRGFVGGTNDPTGLTHLGAREYDPNIGRFLSVDPVQDLSDPQQWHGYAYANNNPTTLSDASGLDPDQMGPCGGYTGGHCPAPAAPSATPDQATTPGRGGGGKGDKRRESGVKRVACGGLEMNVIDCEQGSIVDVPAGCSSVIGYQQTLDCMRDGAPQEGDPYLALGLLALVAIVILGGELVAAIGIEAAIELVVLGGIDAASGGALTAAGTAVGGGGLWRAFDEAGEAAGRVRPLGPGSTSIADDLKGLNPGRQSTVRTVGSEDELRGLYNRWSQGGTDITPTGFNGTRVQLSDGTIVQWRGTSKSGGATIDLNIPGMDPMKVHIQ